MSLAAQVVKPLVHVAVGVVQDAQGRVLLAERPRGKASAGYWEFPGGKFEIAENAERALAREVHEEVGIDVDVAHPWLTYEHEYADKRVRLHFFRVVAWHGMPRARENQRLAWEDPTSLTVGPLLPANARVVRALSLSPVYAVTNVAKSGVGAFMPRLQSALERGVRLIQLRETEFTADQLNQIARRIVELAHRYGARVLVYRDPSVAQRAKADGLHVGCEQLMRLHAPPAAGMWAASCHNAEHLARAAELGADFVTLSPVLPTAAHPGETGLGWAAFEKLARGYALPVYAFGGMKLDLLDTALAHGAHGVALSRDIW